MVGLDLWLVVVVVGLVLGRFVEVGLEVCEVGGGTLVLSSTNSALSPTISLVRLAT